MLERAKEYIGGFFIMGIRLAYSERASGEVKLNIILIKYLTHFDKSYVFSPLSGKFYLTQ